MARSSSSTTATRSAQAKALEKFQAQVDKTYGPGTFVRGAMPIPYEVISTGSIELDIRLGVGGYPRGRIIEIWGQEGVGKSSLAILACIQAQLAFPDLQVGWIDVEHRHDKKWMQSHGFDLGRAYIIQPNDAEDVADMVKDMCRSGLFSIIVVDSIGAMIPEAEMEKDAGDAVVGIQAKIVTRMVKIAAVEADRTKTTVLLINQVRAAIGQHGRDTTTGGGFALKHQSTMKFEVRRTSGGAIKIGSGDNQQQVGHGITVAIERNSVALAHRKAQFIFMYVPTAEYGPSGVELGSEAANLAKEFGLLEQGGSWYTLKTTGERFNGFPAVVEYMRGNRALALDIRERILAMLADDVIDDRPAAAVELEVDDREATS